MSNHQALVSRCVLECHLSSSGECKCSLGRCLWSHAHRCNNYKGYLAHKKEPALGPYGRAMPRALWQSYGGGRFLMSEVPLSSGECKCGLSRSKAMLGTPRSPKCNKYRALGTFPSLLDCRSGFFCENEGPQERCPPRQTSRVERLRVKMEPLLT